MHTTKSKDGTKLAYDTYGDGPPLVYITGASCFRNFQPILKDVKTFATQFKVFNYDRRGRGDSGDTLPYSVERKIEDVEAIIDVIGGPVYLYGHSSGAVLALEVALKLGERVKKVVIYDPPYVHDETEKEEYKLLGVKIQKLIQDGKKSKAMGSFLRGIGIPAIFVMMFRLSHDWKTMSDLAPTLLYDIKLTEDLPPIGKLSNIRTPIQVLVGEKSTASIHGTAKQIADSIQSASLLQVPGQDHMVDSLVLLPYLKSFLDEGEIQS